MRGSVDWSCRVRVRGRSRSRGRVRARGRVRVRVRSHLREAERHYEVACRHVVLLEGWGWG